ncbi:hypothetical protein DL93DRAFT_2080317 [Clavulina sp. PMI_390]|nr:hypothetical protein DL93DRAFT_2080317 [Clavulina sp. PMI_390]
MAALLVPSTRVSRPFGSVSHQISALIAGSWRRNTSPAVTYSRTSELTSPSLPISFSSLTSLSWPSSIAIPSLLAPLLELLPSIVLAVPKKKVSHSRKSMRSANKGLKDKTHIVACPACGGPKLSHHLCASCASQLLRGTKAANRSPAPPSS